jgi:hypothetical protein
LDWCSYEAAKYACEKWHYSMSIPVPPIIKIGVWENKKFIGCITFSRGNTTNLGTAYNLVMTEVCELSRIALNVHQSPVSKIGSIAIRQLKKKENGLRLIVSFADPNHDHNGAIYQAMNWIYTGTSSAGYKFLKNGKEYHSRQVSSNGINKQFGSFCYTPKINECERIKLMPKHRYLYPLDDAMRKQIEPLRKPYPKRATGEVRNALGLSSQEIGSANLTVALQDDLRNIEI